MENYMSEEEYKFNMNQLNVTFFLILESRKWRVCPQ
jgi:hypothetical protein